MIIHYRASAVGSMTVLVMVLLATVLLSCMGLWRTLLDRQQMATLALKAEQENRLATALATIAIVKMGQEKQEKADIDFALQYRVPIPAGIIRGYSGEIHLWQEKKVLWRGL